MCVSKKEGGMGFRNFEDFNQALLAKQAWRMATNPDSLCSRVLRARYFKDGEFLTAGCPKRASYTWKSILHGRELLKEGIIWRIGDGQNIGVWTDNWIPRSSYKRPLGHRPGSQLEKVSELLREDGAGGDEDKLNEHLFEADVEEIKKISVGRAGTDDYLAWNYTKNGVFSVKSAYHLKQQLNLSLSGRASSSDSCDGHKGWLAIWGAEVANKVKVHCWRLVKNGLAVGEELQRRKIKEGVRCIACNRVESLKHRFWDCPHSRSVWEIIRARTDCNLCGPPPDILGVGALQSWLLDWFGRLSQSDLSLGMTAIYQLWHARNDARERACIEDPDATARRILFLVDEWRSMEKPHSSSRVVQRSKWESPSEGWHKANVDGAMPLSRSHARGWRCGFT
jgi:hypothetical protein